MAEDRILIGEIIDEEQLSQMVRFYFISRFVAA